MDTVTIPFATLVFQALGLPGLMFIVWWWDHKAQVKERETYREYINTVLTQYRDDVSGIKRLYENNVDLVHNYERANDRQERLLAEVLGVVSLNTQTQTHLVDAVKNNTFCPTVRSLMGKS